MNRRIVFLPSQDKTDPDPSKNYGVDCLELCFMVDGESGSVEFQLLSNWYLDHIMKRRVLAMRVDVLENKPDYILEKWISPFVADLCYYSKVRLSEDDGYWEDGIGRFQNNIPCFYGYKYLDENERVAKEVAYKLLIERGDGALWEYLEDYYKEVFG